MINVVDRERPFVRSCAGLLLLVGSSLCADFAVSSERELPVCPVNGHPMPRLMRSFIGVSAKELHWGNPHHPDVAVTAEALGDAGIHYAAIKLLWDFPFLIHDHLVQAHFV